MRPGILVVGMGSPAAERMAAHGFDERVAVAPGAEARADTDDQRRVGDLRAEVLLCQNCIDQHVRPQPRTAGSLRIGQDRDTPGTEDAADVLRRLRPLRRHVLDLIASI